MFLGRLIVRRRRVLQAFGYGSVFRRIQCVHRFMFGGRLTVPRSAVLQTAGYGSVLRRVSGASYFKFWGWPIVWRYVLHAGGHTKLSLYTSVSHDIEHLADPPAI